MRISFDVKSNLKDEFKREFVQVLEKLVQKYQVA